MLQHHVTANQGYQTPGCLTMRYEEVSAIQRPQGAASGQGISPLAEHSRALRVFTTTEPLHQVTVTWRSYMLVRVGWLGGEDDRCAGCLCAWCYHTILYTGMKSSDFMPLTQRFDRSLIPLQLEMAPGRETVASRLQPTIASSATYLICLIFLLSWLELCARCLRRQAGRLLLL